MKRKTIKIIAIVLTAVILFGSVVTVVLLSNKNHDVLDVNSETQAEEKTTTPTEQPDESETTVCAIRLARASSSSGVGCSDRNIFVSL